jgi:hypothetical protein
VLLGPNQRSYWWCDWCEIRNDAYARWRQALAEAAGTIPQRVLVTSVHQHDAPLADLMAQRILAEAGAGATLIRINYAGPTHCAANEGLVGPLPTHYGLGQAKVEAWRRIVAWSIPAGLPSRPPLPVQAPEIC